MIRFYFKDVEGSRSFRGIREHLEKTLGLNLRNSNVKNDLKNMAEEILGEVEETVTSTEIDEETDEEIVRKQTRKVGMLFVRGDIVVLVSPPLRTG